MSITKKDEQAAPQGGGSDKVTLRDLDPKDPCHSAVVRSLTEMNGSNGTFLAMTLEMASPELKGKTLNSYADRINDHDNLQEGSRVVVKLGNRNGYADIVGSHKDNYIVKK